MVDNSIQELLKQHESEQLSFKYGTLVEDTIAKLICGFANTSGGTLIVGYSYKKEQIFGSSGGDERRLEKYINLLENVPRYSLSRVEYERKLLIVVEVEKNDGFLSFYKGVAYVRRGSDSLPLSGAELKEKMQSFSNDELYRMLPKMQDSIADLTQKMNESENNQLKSDKKALKYCILGIIFGAIITYLPQIINLFMNLFSK